MHLRTICATLLVAGLANHARSQSWEQLISQQWPGNTIAKVSENEYEAWAKQHLGQRDKAAGYEAFLTAQYRAYGLSTKSPYPKTFLVTDTRRELRSLGAHDAAISEGPEPNGNPSTGGTPTTFGCGDQGNGEITPIGDEDWWTFGLTAPAKILAFTGPGLPGTDLLDPVLELYDNSLNLVAVSDDVRGLHPLVEIGLDPGRYFLNVRDYSSVLTGTYTLDLKCELPDVVAEGPEPNGDPAAGGVPTPFSCGRVGQGDINTGGDSDWWALVLGERSAVIVETNAGATGSPVLDTVVTLRDTSGNRLIVADDGGAGAYSLLITFLDPGVYNLEVTGFSAADTGTYSLQVHCDPGAIPEFMGEVSEPNSSTSTATPFPCQSWGIGEINPASDSDWWRFTVNQPTRITAETGAIRVAVEDTTLELWDGGGNSLAYDDDSGVGLYSLLTATVSPGTYFLDVQSFGGLQPGAYTLRLFCSAVEALEPNSSPLTATQLGCGQSGNGDINPASDSDWWAFTVGSTSRVRGLTGPGDGTALIDTTLTLWDSSATQLAFDDDGGPGNYSLIEILMPPGTYYFDVQSYAGLLTGTYTLTIDCEPFVAEGPEPNGNPVAGGSPTALHWGRVGVGNIAPSVDSDWWRFTVDVPLVVVGTTAAPGIAGPPIADTTLTLWDDFGNRLAFNDNYGGGLLSQIAMPLSPGRYYFDVQGTGSNTGFYNIELFHERSPYLVLPGGCPGSNGIPQLENRGAGGLAPEWPVIGTTFGIDIHNCPPGAPVFAFAGFSMTVSSTGIPLPFDLGALGAPGCVVQVDPATVQLLFADAGGVASWYLPVLPNPLLLGTGFGQQALVFDPPANTLGGTASNLGYGIVTGRP